MTIHQDVTKLLPHSGGMVCVRLIFYVSSVSVLVHSIIFKYFIYIYE